MASGRKVSLLAERYCALAAAVIAAAGCWWQWERFPFPSSWKELLGAIFAASATGAGFLFTAASILISMEQRPVIRWGRETGAYSLFAGYLTRGVWWCLAAALVTLALFMPDFTKPTSWHRSAFCVWLAAVAGPPCASLFGPFGSDLDTDIRKYSDDEQATRWLLDWLANYEREDSGDDRSTVAIL